MGHGSPPHKNVTKIYMYQNKIIYLFRFTFSVRNHGLLSWNCDVLAGVDERQTWKWHLLPFIRRGYVSFYLRSIFFTFFVLFVKVPVWHLACGLKLYLRACLFFIGFFPGQNESIMSNALGETPITKISLYIEYRHSM